MSCTHPATSAPPHTLPPPTHRTCGMPVRAPPGLAISGAHQELQQRLGGRPEDHDADEDHHQGGGDDGGEVGVVCDAVGVEEVVHKGHCRQGAERQARETGTQAGQMSVRGVAKVVHKGHCRGKRGGWGTQPSQGGVSGTVGNKAPQGASGFPGNARQATACGRLQQLVGRGMSPGAGSNTSVQTTPLPARAPLRPPNPPPPSGAHSLTHPTPRRA